MVRGGWRTSYNILAMGAGAFVADAFYVGQNAGGEPWINPLTLRPDVRRFRGLFWS